MKLDQFARAELRRAGISPRKWAQINFGTDTWHGDACGCSDDRCIGYHHEPDNDCGCLGALLTAWANPETRAQWFPEFLEPGESPEVGASD